MRSGAPIMLLWICCSMLGCTSITQIRTEPPTGVGAAGSVQASVLQPPTVDNAAFLQCKTGTSVAGENLHIIEDYGNYLIGYAEFDDQGWGYRHDQQLSVIKDRIDAELANPASDGSDLLVLVFVHGWHHNAHENDCNVQEFRQMVRIAAEGTESAIHSGKLVKHRRVIGIYAGWRGEAIDAPLLRYLTVLDRRDVAERVAKGSVRQLFANLHAQQTRAQRQRIDKMRTVVIGHSFGGLVAYSALSQGMLSDLTLVDAQTPRYCDPRDPRGPKSAGSPIWPDAMILINPAFEASRFEQFHRLAKAASPCLDPETPIDKLVVPSVIVVTARNDQWTGKVFTTGRSVSTLFEGYDRTDAAATRDERTSNLHAIGFVDAYRTHDLDLDSSMNTPRAIGRLLPDVAVKSGLPVWVLSASKAVVDGHNGFLYTRPKDAHPRPVLADWLLDLYDMNCDAAPGMPGCTVY